MPTPKKENTIAAVDDNLEFRIAKLELKAGDVLVVKYNGHLSTELSASVHRIIKAACGENTKTLLIDEDVELSVLTRAEIEARAI